MGFSSSQPMESIQYALAALTTNYVLSARGQAASCGTRRHHGAFCA
jgi:hypothetical protein